MLKRYIHEEGFFGAFVVGTTDIAREAYRLHQNDPRSLQLLAQLLTGSVLLTGNLKNQGSLQVSMRSNTGQLTAEANTQGDVRGFVELAEVPFDADKGLLEQCMSGGVMEVKRRTGASGQVFTSVVELVRGELSLQFANYLLQSEQLRAGVKLGAALDPDVIVKGSGGVMVYALPNCNDDLQFIMEQRLQELPSLGELFADDQGHQKVADFMFGDMPMKELGETSVAFRCDCSQKRMFQVVHSLPLNEIQKMHDESKTFQISCQFCSSEYPISQEDLAAILDLKQNP
jgi:molecular chaperone Hsp33